jgi:hypothetical protein
VGGDNVDPREDRVCGRDAADVEFATLEWVAWYNGNSLLAPLGYVPPAAIEKAYIVAPQLTNQSMNLVGST